MGGQGALFLAIRHQDIYGAAGSLSGGVDIRPFPKEWDMATRLGQYKQNKKLWNDYAVINLIDNLKPGTLQLIIDCGTGDFFYEVNETLHNKLLKKNIPHTYITHPGEHNWDVWNLAVPFQFRFFKQHFNQ
jgi:S-formylglutathione hydrolase FrmB